MQKSTPGPAPAEMADSGRSPHRHSGSVITSALKTLCSRKTHSTQYHSIKSLANQTQMRHELNACEKLQWPFFEIYGK